MTFLTSLTKAYSRRAWVGFDRAAYGATILPEACSRYQPSWAGLLALLKELSVLKEHDSTSNGGSATNSERGAGRLRQQGIAEEIKAPAEEKEDEERSELDLDSRQFLACSRF
jgi:hypothetical protein